MSAVVADTHAIVWYLSNPKKLSETAIQTLDQTSQSGHMIYLSAISVVELQYLTERDRIDLTVLNQILALLNPSMNLRLYERSLRNLSYCYSATHKFSKL